ncbi:2-amino-4-hydroxy-6-hydroxymethyldihydropteridine diphosphokinase [Luteimonas sp. RD2P54]|uniref:2-amino-4-hydroxy-6-hydroxymethyldihydropteridine pyrophosphokinase n=1 Tax=Luteimonas endophytica TaxID=3042023 RepID=A0ABT6JBP8_9GAMM|nr:2-amino-4-hydroxy-6-hydroxymethyldihydropteridine diphosphokinase [Luteimonas endophytica]MDH5824252.1 2-amino-4-hydroxy-6-hydroxymethyldihydropteridine diphosphokinase [Luteimonas endophytica]
MTPPAVACVGLGGNLGDVVATLGAALAALERLPRTRMLRASRLYRSPPWGPQDQPAFLNAAVAVETGLEPRALLDALLAVERAFGRVRAADGSDRWGPRTLDLDLLLYADRRIDVPGLRVPHPHLHERAFALVPLLEVLPDAMIPGIGPARDALAGIAAEDVRALLPAGPAAGTAPAAPGPKLAP